MNRNRVSDDLNHVVDQSTTIIKSKKPLFSIKSLSRFNILNINEDLKYELHKLFENVACESYSIFNLFFNDDILQMIIIHINEYAIKHCFKKNKSHQRIWIFTTMKELRAYLNASIYMNIHQKSFVSNYWNINFTRSLHFEIIKHMSLKR